MSTNSSAEKPQGSAKKVLDAKEFAVSANENVMTEEREEIIAWLQKVKFPQKIVGGVDEIAVWKKIAELDTLYTKALEAERVRYNTLLERYQDAATKYVRELQIQVQQALKGSGSGG